MAQTSVFADLRNGATEGFRVEWRPDIGCEDQFVVVVPPLADDELLRFLTSAVVFEYFHQRTGEMEHSPTTDCFEIDQLHARSVAYELTTNVKHDSAFRCLNVIPTKAEDLAASKASLRCQVQTPVVEPRSR